MELRTRAPERAPDEPYTARDLRRVREGVFRELVELLAASGQIANENKLFLDLLNREKRASTAYENGVVMPHVRTVQARTFVMAFARSTDGVPFAAEGEALYHFFFALVAPPYDDRLYLRVYRTMAALFMDQDWRNDLLSAEDPHRVLRLLEVVRR